jgi:diguanylate cyclase (GGDEF)-like protein
MDSKSISVVLLLLLLSTLVALGLMAAEFYRVRRNYAALQVRLEQEAAEIEKLRSLAFSDYLTGLPNRVLLENRLLHALSVPQASEKFVVVFIDLDNFKNINDSFGHDVGDEVLRIVATALRARMRPADTIARIGGDEFIIVANTSRPSDRESIIAKIADVFHASVTVKGHSLSIRASIGHATFPDDGLTLERLLVAADKDMYAQKRTKGIGSLAALDC